MLGFLTLGSLGKSNPKRAEKKAEKAAKQEAKQEKQALNRLTAACTRAGGSLVVANGQTVCQMPTGQTAATRKDVRQVKKEVRKEATAIRRETAAEARRRTEFLNACRKVGGKVQGTFNQNSWGSCLVDGKSVTDIAQIPTTRAMNQAAKAEKAADRIAARAEKKAEKAERKEIKAASQAAKQAARQEKIAARQEAKAAAQAAKLAAKAAKGDTAALSIPNTPWHAAFAQECAARGGIATYARSGAKHNIKCDGANLSKWRQRNKFPNLNTQTPDWGSVPSGGGGQTLSIPNTPWHAAFAQECAARGGTAAYARSAEKHNVKCDGANLSRWRQRNKFPNLVSDTLDPGTEIPGGSTDITDLTTPPADDSDLPGLPNIPGGPGFDGPSMDWGGGGSPDFLDPGSDVPGLPGDAGGVPPASAGKVSECEYPFDGVNPVPYKDRYGEMMVLTVVCGGALNVGGSGSGSSESLSEAEMGFSSGFPA